MVTEENEKHCRMATIPERWKYDTTLHDSSEIFNTRHLFYTYYLKKKNKVRLIRNQAN